MSEDDTAILAMADARMSTASIAAIMGKSEARVYNRLAFLRGQREGLPAPKADLMPAPAPPPPPPPRPRPPSPPRAFAPIPEERRWRPVSATKLRYIGWFLNAGWALDTVARLFDVEPEDVRQVLPNA